MLDWLVQWCIAFALAVLWVGKLAPDELAFAAGSAVIAATASHVAIREGLRGMKPELRSALQIWRMPRYLVTGAWEVTLVLLEAARGKKMPSLFRSVPFDGGPDAQVASFRRAIAVTATSATPNFVVLGIDGERRRLVYHQLRESAVPEMTKRLGARP